MKKFKSVRNGQIAELVSENEKQIILKLESGEQKTLSSSTVKRWWKQVEDEVQELPQSEEVEQEEKPAEEKNEAIIEQKDESHKEEKKMEKLEKEKKSNKSKNITPHALKDFIEKEALLRNCTLYSGKVKALVSIKIEGKACMAFTFSGKGINLWLRSLVCEGITAEYNKTNHLFDARIKLSGEDKKTKDLILKLMEAAIQYQLKKKAAK